MEKNPILRASNEALSSEVTSYANQLRQSLDASNRMSYPEYKRVQKLALKLIAQKKAFVKASRALGDKDLVAKDSQFFLETILAIRARLKYLNPKTHLEATIDLHKKKIAHHRKSSKRLRNKLRRVSLSVFKPKEDKRAKKNDLIRQINAHQEEALKAELKLSALTSQLPRIEGFF